MSNVMFVFVCWYVQNNNNWIKQRFTRRLNSLISNNNAHQLFESNPMALGAWSIQQPQRALSLSLLLSLRAVKWKITLFFISIARNLLRLWRLPKCSSKYDAEADACWKIRRKKLETHTGNERWVPVCATANACHILSPYSFRREKKCVMRSHTEIHLFDIITHAFFSSNIGKQYQEVATALEETKKGRDKTEVGAKIPSSSAK